MYIRTIILLFCASISIVHTEKSLQLKKVIILSRHSVRTPLSKYLQVMTPKIWPRWKEKMGYLTAKGTLLEGFMGEYFSMWLIKEGILPIGCPTEKEFYVYANSKQRTKASARAFVTKAFPNCNVTVHHSDTADPIFHPVLHNNSEIFKDIVKAEMSKLLSSLNLNNSYEYLEDILNYKHSELCEKEKKCDLSADKNKIINVIAGEKPNLSGPLKIGNSVVDAFVMQNYEGFREHDVAWGLINTVEEWENIMNLSKGYHNVIFNTTLVAKDIAAPLIKYISSICLNDDTPTITLLMGHDANMYTLLNGMQFKPYNLLNQYEVTPVGGKIVFQKWYDIEKNKYLLKIDYIYQSTRQLRNGERLSLCNPPQFRILELEQCPIDQSGFCSWEDFKKLLGHLFY